MIIVGHPWVASPTFKKVFAIEEIDRLQADEIALIEPLPESTKMAQHCQQNRIDFAITVNEIRHALFANALGATYVVCQQEDAMEIQPIAERYLFDTKVLVLVEEEKEIERMARFSIDGVIFPQAIHQA
jgi:hypothetical protein